MTTQTITLNGAPAHVELTGRGAPLLLIGGAVPAGWAEPLVRELAPSRLVVNYDYRAPDGWSGTPQPRSQLALGADAVAVLDALDIADADLLGYSRGAVAAYSAAARMPSRVRRLILLAPVAPFPDTLVVQSTFSLPEDPDQIMELLTQSVFSKAFIIANTEETRAMTAAVMQHRASVVRVDRSEEQPLPDRAEVTQSTLIITAGADQMVEGTHSLRLQRAIPHSRVAIIEDASHMVPYERPAEVARLIDEFLDED